MRVPFAFIKSSAAVFDPATLTLSGWWRADFASSPWVGTASTGFSGSRNLTEATNPPSTGTTQNGKTPALFDGTNDVLANANDFHTTFCSLAAGSIWALVYVVSAGADSAGAGNRYDNKGILAMDGGSSVFTLTFSTAGAAVDAYSGGWQEVNTACSASAYHLLQVKWDSTNLKLKIDSGSWNSTACGALDNFGSGQLIIGRQFDTKYANFRLLDVGFDQTALSDGDFTNIVSYCNSRYGLSL